MTRKRLADIRLILGFDFDTDISVAEVEDYLRAREEMVKKSEQNNNKIKKA